MCCYPMGCVVYFWPCSVVHCDTQHLCVAINHLCILAAHTASLCIPSAFMHTSLCLIYDTYVHILLRNIITYPMIYVYHVFFAKPNIRLIYKSPIILVVIRPKVTADGDNPCMWPAHCICLTDPTSWQRSPWSIRPPSRNGDRWDSARVIFIYDGNPFFISNSISYPNELLGAGICKCQRGFAVLGEPCVEEQHKNVMGLYTHIVGRGAAICYCFIVLTAIPLLPCHYWTWH